MARHFEGRRMEKEWSSLAAISVGFTANATAVGSSGSFSSPTTLIRMLGEYVIGGAAGGTFSAGDECQLVVGIAKVSSDVATLGATAMPDPSQEPQYPWLYWAAHPFVFTAADESEDSDLSTVRHSFDIRTKRKFKPSSIRLPSKCLAIVTSS
jgi:hypothetical protein